MSDDLQMLEEAIPAAIDCLAPQGRLAIISFQSLEDRTVRRTWLKAAGKGPAPGDMYGPYLQLVKEQSPWPALVKLRCLLPQVCSKASELSAACPTASAKAVQQETV